jgi:predicted nucleic acid-binding protein
VIYFDSSYVAKTYLFERGSSEIRALVATEPEVACCAIGQIELASVLHRKLREGALDAARYGSVRLQFEEDLRNSVWLWVPVTPGLLEQARQAFGALPASVFVRANDALHLVCARESGFKGVYSNDRHFLAAAAYFGLKGIDVIAP